MGSTEPPFPDITYPQVLTLTTAGSSPGNRAHKSRHALNSNKRILQRHT
jgi:hypothetical protein